MIRMQTWVYNTYAPTRYRFVSRFTVAVKLVSQAVSIRSVIRIQPDARQMLLQRCRGAPAKYDLNNRIKFVSQKKIARASRWLNLDPSFHSNG